MEDKFTLFAALACAVAILIVMWWEHRPSFSWVRYLFGFDKHDSDTMPWDEVVGRIERRARKAYNRDPDAKALSNGVYAGYYETVYPNGDHLREVMLTLKRQDMMDFPIVVTINVETGYGEVTGVGATPYADPYQWMMEQVGDLPCYEIARRAYICEQRGERGDNERAAVRAEYISWIARRFI